MKIVTYFSSALSSNGGVMTLNIDKLTVKEAISNINYVRAVAGLEHVGLGLSGNPKDYAMLLAELARDRLWSNAALKKLVGGNIVRVLREVWNKKNNFLAFAHKNNLILYFFFLPIFIFILFYFFVIG
jgi:microsomal dipeptidase-like Zn-dependent dipeptidase